MPPAPAQPRFRISSHSFFLTYPQCTLTPLELATFLKTIATTSYILVARELHDDGRPHLHSLIIFADKLNVRSQRKFDHRGFHPNVQSTRDRQQVKDYCTKGAPSSDDLFEEGTFDSGKKGSASKEAWQAALDATTPEAVLAAVAIASPRDFTVSHDRIVAYANSKANVVPEYVPPPEETFIVPEHLAAYIATEFRKPVRFNFPPTFFPPMHFPQLHLRAPRSVRAPHGNCVGTSLRSGNSIESSNCSRVGQLTLRDS